MTHNDFHYILDVVLPLLSFMKEHKKYKKLAGKRVIVRFPPSCHQKPDE